MKKKLLTDYRYLLGAIVLTALMAVGKFFGLLPISWWIVFLPLWLPFFLIGAFAFLLMAFVAYSVFTKKEAPAPQPETDEKAEQSKTIFFTNEP